MSFRWIKDIPKFTVADLESEISNTGGFSATIKRTTEFDQKITNDVLEIMTVYSAKIHGMRRYKNKNS